MIRALCGLVVLAIALVALIVSDRAKPIVVEPHASGHWTPADYPSCVNIHLPPLRPTPNIQGRKAVEPYA